MLEISAALPLLTQPKKIFITTHHKPDGDAMGATLGLYHYFRQTGHTPVVITPSEIPDFLSWMPGVEHVLNFESEPKPCLEVLSKCDLIFCLDFNRPDRIKLMEKPLREAPQPKILIDHHLLPDTAFFAYGISQPDKSSTCEMVYDFILLAGGAPYLSGEVMQCLYTGVMTDTGSFRFPGTTASVHAMIASFKEKGLEHSRIHEEVFDSWSEKRMRFLGYVLYEKMQVFPEQETGIIALSRQDMERFSVSASDTEGLVNYPLSISGINRSVLLIERKEEIKLSFRSKGNIDVSTFARMHFDGGGHFNAAGGRSAENLEKTLARLEKLLDIHKNHNV